MLQLFAEVQNPPGDFEKFVEKTNNSGNIIYYKRKGRHAEYRCAQCGMEFAKRNVKPVVNDPEICPICGKYGKLKWQGRSRTETVWNYYLLYQATETEKLLIRGYETTTTRSPWSRMRRETTETCRWFLARGYKAGYHRYAQWGNGEWIAGESRAESFNGAYVYPGYEEVIEHTDLKYCPVKGLEALMTAHYYVPNDKERLTKNIIKAYAQCPQLEMLYKIGFKKLCEEIIKKGGITGLINKRKKNLEDILGIEKRDLPWILEDRREELHRLKVCQYIKQRGLENTAVKNNRRTREMLLELFYRDTYSDYTENAKKKETLNIMQYMSVEQAYNRICGYALREMNGSRRNAQREYSDYLSMRAKLGYDMTNSVYLHPKNLHETYAALREEEERWKDETYITEKTKEFPKIAERYEKLCKKYCYENGKLLVRPARDVEEIILEGRTLHHCVGSSTQRYMRNHNEGKAFILMLRKKEHPEEPYATIEINGEHIEQWYQANDKKPDKEIIDPWLEEYIRQLEGKKKTKMPETLAG